MELHEIERDAAVVREFLFAGDAQVVLESLKTGTRYAYRVKRPEGTEGCYRRGHWDDRRFVTFLLEGARPLYVGALYRTMGSWTFLNLSTASAYPAASPEVRGFDHLLLLLKFHEVSRKMKIYNVGLCGRCGQSLAEEEYRAGLHSECLP
jgi:hypothetical protein